MFSTWCTMSYHQKPITIILAIMEGIIDYEALVGTTGIEDITPRKANQSILRRIKNNDPNFDKLCICSRGSYNGEDFDYIPSYNEDKGWLGYFIGQSTTLKQFWFHDNAVLDDHFYHGFNFNKSIQKMRFLELNTLEEENMFARMEKFFKENHSLIEVHVDSCILGAEGVRRLSNLLQYSTSNLQRIYLGENSIDDEAVEHLTQALMARRNQIKLLSIESRQITIKGWKLLSAILSMPKTKLETLDLSGRFNAIGDEELVIFVDALGNNQNLKTFRLSRENRITAEGWKYLSTLLCDTSSVNNTYSSNHTISSIGYFGTSNIPRYILQYLEVNGSSRTKQQVVMEKILHSYSHFDMEPFFEWEFKVLPLMIDWFAKAAACTVDKKIKKMRLSVMYDFIKEFPMLYIEPVTRKEIEFYTSVEDELCGYQSQQEKLKHIQQCKANAMRRLGVNTQTV